MPETVDHETGSGGDPPPPVVVPDPGRHSRARREGLRVVERVEARLPGPLRGRLALRATHLVVVSALVTLGVAVALWTALRAAPEEVPVPMAHTSPAATSGPPGPATGAPSALAPSGSASPSAAVQVVVDIVGKVRRPGVATLPAGSRVVDALRRAGGARTGVDLSTLNLARVLVDGEQIVVGRQAGPAQQAPAPGSAPGTPVSLNTAGLEQLESLPGVGPVTAQKILDWRTEHGAFGSVDELLEVDGIGAKTLANLSPHVVL
ncbi:ComEA family DNA-binding protein [Nocardioides marmoriginsengisoli]|uniref:ComEA family DNA-binding protein n=2 Tax=Nocardioides marmoriginsengisoli TaxID=661483 RepID=A0A3N0CKK5_9ACTN|nr:ComEA family DNA-binding protein [Nocardioides marmoriginsengisoli]